MVIIRKLVLILTILSFLCSVGFSKPASDKNLKHKLENAYENFIKSLQTGDENKIKSTMASKTYMKIKSKCKKRGTSFAKVMKRMAKYYPDISNLKFLKVLNKGTTAILVYYNDSKERFKNDVPMVDFTLIKFVKENSYWKIKKIKIRTIQKFNKDGSLKNFDESML